MVFTALRTRLTTYFSPRAPKSSAGNAAIGTRVQSGRVTKNPQATRESVTDHEGTPTDRGGAKASRDRGDHRVSPGGSKTSSQPAGVETNYLMSGGLSGSAPANHKVGAHQVDDFSDDPSTPRRKTPEVGRGKGKQVKRARQDSEDSDSDVNPPKKKPTTKAKGKATPAKGKGKATPKKSAPKSTKSAATPSKAKPAGKGKAAAKPRAKTPAKETVPEGAQPDSIPAEKKQLGKATPKKAARKHDEVEPDDVSEDKRPAKIAKTEQSQLARDNNAKGEEPVASIPIGYKDWTDNEVDLFNELNDRGFRPLLTDTWTLDFPTLPLNLFCDDDAEVLIKPIHGTSFRGE